MATQVTIARAPCSARPVFAFTLQRCAGWLGCVPTVIAYDFPCWTCCENEYVPFPVTASASLPLSTSTRPDPARPDPGAPIETNDGPPPPQAASSRNASETGNPEAAAPTVLIREPPRFTATARTACRQSRYSGS